MCRTLRGMIVNKSRDIHEIPAAFGRSTEIKELFSSNFYDARIVTNGTFINAPLN